MTDEKKKIYPSSVITGNCKSCPYCSHQGSGSYKCLNPDVAGLPSASEVSIPDWCPLDNA